RAARSMPVSHTSARGQPRARLLSLLSVDLHTTRDQFLLVRCLTAYVGLEMEDRPSSAAWMCHGWPDAVGTSKRENHKLNGNEMGHWSAHMAVPDAGNSPRCLKRSRIPDRRASLVGIQSPVCRATTPSPFHRDCRFVVLDWSNS